MSEDAKDVLQAVREELVAERDMTPREVMDEHMAGRVHSLEERVAALEDDDTPEPQQTPAERRTGQKLLDMVRPGWRERPSAAAEEGLTLDESIRVDKLRHATETGPPPNAGECRKLLALIERLRLAALRSSPTDTQKASVGEGEAVSDGWVDGECEEALDSLARSVAEGHAVVWEVELVRRRILVALRSVFADGERAIEILTRGPGQVGSTNWDTFTASVLRGWSQEEITEASIFLGRRALRSVPAEPVGGEVEADLVSELRATAAVPIPADLDATVRHLLAVIQRLMGQAADRLEALAGEVGLHRARSSAWQKEAEGLRALHLRDVEAAADKRCEGLRIERDRLREERNNAAHAAMTAAGVPEGTLLERIEQLIEGWEDAEVERDTEVMDNDRLRRLLAQRAPEGERLEGWVPNWDAGTRTPEDDIEFFEVQNDIRCSWTPATLIIHRIVPPEGATTNKENDHGTDEVDGSGRRADRPRGNRDAEGGDDPRAPGAGRDACEDDGGVDGAGGGRVRSDRREDGVAGGGDVHAGELHRGLTPPEGRAEGQGDGAVLTAPTSDEPTDSRASVTANPETGSREGGSARVAPPSAAGVGEAAPRECGDIGEDGRGTRCSLRQGNAPRYARRACRSVSGSGIRRRRL